MPPTRKRRRGETPPKKRWHSWLYESQLLELEVLAKEERRSIADMQRIVVDYGIAAFKLQRRR